MAIRQLLPLHKSLILHLSPSKFYLQAFSSSPSMADVVAGNPMTPSGPPVDLLSQGQPLPPDAHLLASVLQDKLDAINSEIRYVLCPLVTYYYCTSTESYLNRR